MTNHTHISYLDAIRGLAALTVITEHFIIAYGLPCEADVCQSLFENAPLHIFWDGGAAVSMFFVLSGLVLSLKYFRHANKPDLTRFNLTTYIIGRMFRIWIPYSVVLLISAVLYQATVSHAPLSTLLSATAWINDMWRNNPLTLSDMLREVLLIQLPASIVLLPQAWTLTIELVLSLLMPVGLLLIEKGTRWLLFFALFAVILLGVSAFIGHFIMGLLIARYHKPIIDTLSQQRLQRRLVLLIGLSLYAAGAYLNSDYINEKLIWFNSGLGAALILIYVLSSSRSQAFLSYPLLSQIGKISYSAYLIHMAVLICITPYWLKALERVTSQHVLLWLIGWLLTLATVHGLSLLFYRFLETPCMALGKYVIKTYAVSN